MRKGPTVKCRVARVSRQLNVFIPLCRHGVDGVNAVRAHGDHWSHALLVLLQRPETTSIRKPSPEVAPTTLARITPRQPKNELYKGRVRVCFWPLNIQGGPKKLLLFLNK